MGKGFGIGFFKSFGSFSPGASAFGAGARGRDEPYAAGRFALELDGRQAVGFVSAIDGGHFQAESVGSKVGNDPLTTRFPGKPKYEEITLQIGMARSPSFWQWVKASLENKPERRSGAVVGYDFNNRERSRRTFTNALLSEVGFPALDASSAQPATLTVKIAPEQLSYKQGDGSPLLWGLANDELRRQKMWSQQNFTFLLDRFRGDPSLRHAKVEGFSVKQSIIDHPIGGQLETLKEVGRLELPTLQVTFSEAKLSAWMKWYEDSVARGNHATEETTGAIVYYAGDRSTELMRVEIDGVGLTGLEVERYEAGKDQIARVKASLYVESMKLIPGRGTT